MQFKREKKKNILPDEAQLSHLLSSTYYMNSARKNLHKYLAANAVVLWKIPQRCSITACGTYVAL